MNKIIMPRNITETEIEKILEEFLSPAYSIHMDFINTNFISPFAAIILLKMIDAAIKGSNKKVHFILKDKTDKKSYIKPCMYILYRLGFFDNLSENVSIYPYVPKVKGNPKGKNESILEITRVQEQSASEIISKVEKAIIKNTDYPRDQKDDICIMVAEMIQNIFYHSRAPKSGMIAIQNFEKFNYMQMAIVDSGIGIPESIRNSEEYSNKKLNDYETIIEAIKKGVSSLGKSEDRGEGLPRCIELAKRHKAKIYIRSNSGYVYATFSKNRGALGKTSFLTGTQILVNFPLN